MLGLLMEKLVYVTQGESYSLQPNMFEAQREEVSIYCPMYDQPENLLWGQFIFLSVKVGLILLKLVSISPSHFSDYFYWKLWTSQTRK